MNAYDEAYLFDAMAVLGEAFDYAQHEAGVGKKRFFELFVSTGVADAFGAGSPRYVAGASGAELVWDVCAKAGLEVPVSPAVPFEGSEKSSDYWCGWALAFYQWRTGRTFRNIAEHFSLNEIEALYPMLHEASEEKLVDVLEERIRRRNAPARLKTLRQARGMSQETLAAASGVSLRAIQQYEQRRKNIDHARVSSLFRLAQALGCRMEDLLEFTPESAGGNGAEED